MIENPSRLVDSSRYHTRLCEGSCCDEARTRTASRVTDHVETTDRYHSLHRTPRACTMKRETDIRWQRRQRAKGRKRRFPASTTDTALAPRYTRRGTAHARRRLDSAHAHAPRPHLFPSFRCKTPEFSCTGENFRNHVTVVTRLERVSATFAKGGSLAESVFERSFERGTRGHDVPAIDVFQSNSAARDLVQFLFFLFFFFFFLLASCLSLLVAI